ncbi:MAG TPA: DMT family transporter [Candidatus Krumholzibacteria bacterium]|nr:DMT family transporter [Candidatus Krumholzibacteria bacterium]
MTDATHHSHRAELEIVAGSFIISFSGVFVKIAHVGPTAAGVYRNLFGAIALFAIALARRDSFWKGWPQLRWAILAGMAFATDIFFWHRSIEYVGPGLATILGNFQVFFMAAAGILLFHEPATARFLLSVPVAITGLFLLVGLNWSHFDAVYRRGVLFGIVTALSYATYLLCLRGARRERERLSAPANLAWVSGITTLLLACAAAAGSESLGIHDTQTAVVLVAYGVLCQAMGWIIISRNLSRVDASRASLILLMQPALTFVWDILFFHRPTSGIEVVGALIAISAIYLGGVRPARTREAT